MARRSRCAVAENMFPWKRFMQPDGVPERFGCTTDYSRYTDQTWQTMISLTKLFQLYSCCWDAIVVVIVELEIFESLEINICLLNHLETSCIRQKSTADALPYMLGKSTALKGLVPCCPFVLSACKQSISVASS